MSRHVRELHADHWVVDQALAEGLSLVGIFDRFFIADAREADALNYYAHAFVVEVHHYY